MSKNEGIIWLGVAVSVAISIIYIQTRPEPSSSNLGPSEEKVETELVTEIPGYDQTSYHHGFHDGKIEGYRKGYVEGELSTLKYATEEIQRANTRGAKLESKMAAIKNQEKRRQNFNE